MSLFQATVLAKGKKTLHYVHADSKREALQLAKLKFQGTVLKVEPGKIPVEEQFKNYISDIKDRMSKKKVKPDNLIAAISQLAVMTNAGISIHDALADIALSTKDETLKKIFHALADSIDAGNSLYEGVSEFRYELGNLTLALIDLGEQTGNISEALTTLEGMLAEIRDNVKKFKKAMAYPRNVMVAMMIAFSVLLTYVVPKFESLFSKLGADLPLPTMILMTLSDLLVDHGLKILIAIILTVVAINYFKKKHKSFRYKIHQLLLRTKIINNVILYSTLSRFTLVFTELIKAGIPIADALDTSITMIDNLVIQNKLKTLRADVEKGQSLVEAFDNTKLFENMIIQMIRAGESGGQLDTMFTKVSHYYKMKFDAVIDNLQEAIEPIMLAIIAVMVLLLALGIFMPMWDLGSAAKRH